MRESAAAEAIRIDRQQADGVRATFEASTPALAQMKPCRVSVIRTPRSIRTIRSPPAARPRPGAASLSYRSAHCIASADGSIVRQVDQLALGLADDLVGDDQYVAIVQWRVALAQTVGDQPDEIVAGPNFGDVIDADDLDAPLMIPCPAGAT